jgi:hypothetical protein
LIVDCEPINFEGYGYSNEKDFLTVKGSEKRVDAYHPNDGGIVQKTFF